MILLLLLGLHCIYTKEKQKDVSETQISQVSINKLNLTFDQQILLFV